MYAVETVLGKGTYGKVYAASELVTRRRFAIKRLLLDEGTHSDCIASLRELDMMARLDHPHLMPLTNVLFSPPARSPVEGLIDDQVALVMPRADGTLDQFITASTTLKQRKSLLWQMLAGLHYIHQHRIIHRDLKPQNFLLFEEHLRISDFGLATNYLAAEARTPQMVTIWYRAPEILLNGDYDLASDVWSLGCIFAETISGRPLFPHREVEDMLANIFTLLGSAPKGYRYRKPMRRRRPYVPLKELKGNTAALHQDLALNAAQLKDFDESEGTYRHFLDLLNRMLTVSTHQRPTCEELLKHEFFDGYRVSLASVIRPLPTPHRLQLHPLRKHGVALIDRQAYGIQYRVKFLALDILDRILAARPELEDPGEIRRLTLVAIYLAEKYWMGERACSIDFLTVEDEDEDDFKGYAARERYVLRDLLGYCVYRATLYDYLPIGSTSKDVGRAFHLFRQALPFHGLRLDYLAATYHWVVKHWYEDWEGQERVEVTFPPHC
jgi:serine/threonine protein kinase